MTQKKEDMADKPLVAKPLLDEDSGSYSSVARRILEDG